MIANIPATQTVIEIKAPGGPEVLVPVTRPVPEPEPGEILVRIAGAGVNRADCLQRMGRYPMPPGAPDIPGLECSGTVVKIGEGVGGRQVGDRVCALMIGDGYGEYAAVPAVQACRPGGGRSGRRRRPARNFLHGVDQRFRAHAPTVG